MSWSGPTHFGYSIYWKWALKVSCREKSVAWEKSSFEIKESEVQKLFIVLAMQTHLPYLPFDGETFVNCLRRHVRGDVRWQLDRPVRRQLVSSYIVFNMVSVYYSAQYSVGTSLNFPHRLLTQLWCAVRTCSLQRCNPKLDKHEQACFDQSRPHCLP